MYTTCVLVSVQRWENHTFGTESNTCHSSTWGWRCLCDLNSSLLMNFLSSLRIRALRRSIGSDRRRTVGIHMCHRKVKWFSDTRALRYQILSRVVTSVGGNNGFYAGTMPCFVLRLWLETTTMGGLHPDQGASGDPRSVPWSCPLFLPMMKILIWQFWLQWSLFLMGSLYNHYL